MTKIEGPIKIVIPGILPDLNAEIFNVKKHRNEYYKTKKKFTNIVMLVAMSQCKKVQLDCQIAIKLIWFCKNKRKDPDNVAFGQKYILDGLVAAKIIRDDNWDTLKGGILHLFDIDKEKPRVEVYIYPKQSWKG